MAGSPSLAGDGGAWEGGGKWGEVPVGRSSFPITPPRRRPVGDGGLPRRGADDVGPLEPRRGPGVVVLRQRPSPRAGRAAQQPWRWGRVRLAKLPILQGVWRGLHLSTSLVLRLSYCAPTHQGPFCLG